MLVDLYHDIKHFYSIFKHFLVVFENISFLKVVQVIRQTAEQN